MKRLVLGMSLLLILLVAAGGIVCGENGDSDLKLSGNATLEFKYGLGDAWRLWQRQYPINGFQLGQYINISVSGEPIEGWYLKGGLKSDPDEFMSFSTIELENKDILGKYGIQTLSSNNKYVLIGRRLATVSVENKSGPLKILGTFAQVRSIPVEKVFYGRNSSDTVLFEADGPYLPKHNGDYLVGTMSGLLYYNLSSSGIIDTDYVVVSLRYEDGISSSLEDYFDSYNLTYLTDEDGVLKAGQGRAIPKGRTWIAGDTNGNYLLLKTDEYGLIREDIKELIRKYNLDHGLSGDAKKVYPFEAGSAEETAFVDGLRDEHLYIEAGYEEGDNRFLDIKLSEYERERFYYVGNDNIEPGSLRIYIGADDTYIPAENVSGLTYSINYKGGLVDFIFPSGFFTDYDSIKVSYEYKAAEGAYPLGASVVVGSERVYINDKLMRRNVDYTINYQFGLLFLYKEVETTDVVRIQYELSHEGNGLSLDGGRYLMGASATYQVNPDLLIGLDFYRIAGSLPGSNENDATSNEYMIFGANGLYQANNLKAKVDMAYSKEINPADGFIPTDSLLNESDRIATGAAIGLEVNKYFTKGEIFVKYESIDAGYMPIGWYTRKALDKLIAGVSYDLTPAITLGYSHTSQGTYPMVGMKISEGTGTKRWIEEATLKFIPYQVDLAVSYSRVDKLDVGDSLDFIEKKVQLGINRQVFKGWDLSLKLEGLDSKDLIDPVLSYSSYNATALFKGRLTPNVSLLLKRIQPLSMSERTKEGTGLSLNWSNTYGSTYMNAGYDYDYSNLSVGSQYERNSSSKLNGRISTALSDSIRVSGSTRLEFKEEIPFDAINRSTGMKASLSSNLNLKNFSVDGNASLDRAEYPDLEKVTDKINYGLSARYNGWENITPRISLSHTLSTTESPLVDIVPSLNTTGKLIVNRRLSQDIRFEETVTIEDKKNSKDDLITYSVKESYSRRLSPRSDYSISLEGIIRNGVKDSKETKEREFTAKVIATTPIQNDWTLNLDCGYTLGNNVLIEDGDYHFLTLSAKMTIYF